MKVLHVVSGDGSGGAERRSLLARWRCHAREEIGGWGRCGPRGRSLHSSL